MAGDAFDAFAAYNFVKQFADEGHVNHQLAAGFGQAVFNLLSNFVSLHRVHLSFWHLGGEKTPAAHLSAAYNTFVAAREQALFACLSADGHMAHPVAGVSDYPSIFCVSLLTSQARLLRVQANDVGHAA